MVFPRPAPLLFSAPGPQRRSRWRRGGGCRRVLRFPDQWRTVARAAAFWALLVAGFLGTSGRATAKEFTFVAYNLANFSPLSEPGRAKPAKSAKATDALIGILREINADILGVCEMGARPQFDHFLHRLADAGLTGYRYTEYLEAADTGRHLALVSRLPIVARHSEGDLSFDANGSREKVRRGFLDVTVQAESGFRMRLVGVHLKSKLAVRQGEEVLRRHESHLLRRHLDAIMREHPNLPLLVYGDFNDTRESVHLRDILGPRGSPASLRAVSLEDAQGDRWTYHWKATDTYSRIDFLLVNAAASQVLRREASYLHRCPDWNIASDHRPLVARFRAPTP